MILDLVVVVLVGLAFWRGFMKGLIISIVMLLGLLLGGMIALRCTIPLTNVLRGQADMQNPQLPFYVFFFLLIAVIVLVYILGRLIEKLVNIAGMNLVNKIAGGFFSALIALFILSSAIWMAGRTQLISDNVKQQSFTWKLMEDFSLRVTNSFGAVLPFMNKTYDKLGSYIDQVADPTFHGIPTDTTDAGTD